MIPRSKSHPSNPNDEIISTRREQRPRKRTEGKTETANINMLKSVNTESQRSQPQKP